VRIIKDLIPFQQETVGTNRLRKFLSLALIIGLLQTFSWTYQIVEAPKSFGAQQYNPADATGSIVIPSGVDTITVDVVGGGGGWGGKDGNGNTNPQPGARGRVIASFKVSAGQYLGIWPGGAGTNGSDGAQNSGGGTGGTSSYNPPYNGGNGGNAGSSGSSGGGGGGGAASLVTIGSTIVAVAGGSGGGGGQSNAANTGQAGKDDDSAVNNSTTGGAGIQTSTANDGAGKNCTTSTNDGGGSGGGGGGHLYGGAGGQLINGASGECAGDGGYRGRNFISNSGGFVAFNTTNTTISTSNTSAGYVNLSFLLNMPSNISVTPTSNTFGSISVSWATASGASSFDVKLYDSTGNTLLSTKSVSAGNYSTTITSSDYSGIANGATYKVSVTAKGDGVRSVDSTESGKITATTNAPIGTSSDTDTAVTLDGNNGNHLFATDNSLVRIPDTFTAQAWIYPTSFGCKGGAASPWSSNDGYCHIISKGGFFSLLTASTSNVTDAGVRPGQLGFNWNGAKFSKYVLNLNEWHHIAFSREGTGSGQAKLYVDGALIYTDTATTNAADVTRDFTIGASRSDSANSNSIYGTFIGQIDEVKLSKRYRTQGEIQYDLHHHNVTDSSFNLYYDFNENSGNKIFNRAIGATSASDLSFIGNNNFDSQKIYQADTTTASAYTIVKFYRDYLVNANGWTSPSNVSSMRYLVVGGGGGGGGGYNGGGGGAGGYRETNTAILPNTVYNIEVGVGGIGAIYGYLPTAGGDSAIRNNLIVTDSITASGGGSGATEQGSFGSTSAAASSGGSGGGGVHSGGLTPGTGNKGGFTPSEGNTGGSGSSSGIVNAGEGYFAGGGGGGAGGAGGAAQTSGTGVPGNGGSGVTTNITGSPLSIAGGGAGAGRFVTANVQTQKSATATHGGGSGACTTPCSGVDTGTSGTANTGGGGGGGATGLALIGSGGAGGSGFVVIRYITNKPTIITQPTDDTSTVGAVDTFTISTSAAPAPLTKSVQWQFTADTTTVNISSITGWTNVSTGTGFTTDTFTTAALTKSMNKYRYRAIVKFSDTATISSIETSSVVTLTVNDSITISSDTSTITRKYGDSQTVRTITYAGGTTSTGAVGTSTSHTINTPFGALANGKIYVDTSTSTAKFKVDTGTAVGTYYETITVTDFKGAISSYTQKVVVNPADTLTVQADTLTAITYNPNGMTINPTASYTGLVNSDTQSAITLTFKSSTLASCANGGLCNLGDTGPGGGTIFYDAGSTQSWGRYIEASPIDWYTVAKGGNGTENVTWCSNTNYFITGLVDAIGYGLANKQTMAASCDLASGYKNTAPGMLWVTNGGAPGRYSGGGKTDWFLPSLSEMDALNNYSGGSLLPQKYYWIAANIDATIAPTPAYSCCSQSWPYRAVGGATKNSAYPIRPMRYVTPDLSLTSYNSTTPPTNAGTYTITPSTLVLANNVDTSNYVSVIYRSSTFTINAGIQDTLTITSKLGSYNGGTSTLKLTTTGGTDTGTVSYAIVSGGSASGCSISTNVLSFTSAGTCKVVATKAATINYLVAFSDTVTITLSAFISHQPVQTQQYPNQIPINGKNALDTTTVTIPDVTSVTSTGAGAYTIVGTGFTGVSRVVIGGSAVTIASSTSTTINITGASGLTGPLIIECSDGRMGPVPFWLIL
jgi:hypothetical protein